MNMNTFGIFVVITGLLILGGRSIGIPFGRLPGDIIIEREGFTLMFPITTMIILSIIWSVIRHLIAK